jgi:tRNA modification GTPase
MTPEGRGAIAVIRVWGDEALAVADRAFRPRTGQPLRDTPPGRPRVGRIGAGTGDEVVAIVLGHEPPQVEIHGHGGPAAVALVIDALVAEGVERRQPVAWVRHEARSLVAAEAVVDLARASTVRSAEILLEQSQGALEREATRAIALADSHDDAALAAIDALLDRATVGLKLIAGWRVVLAGRPNVGKSRLLNALAGYERAIVDPTPGTTRDVITVRTALGGWPVELADTAGLRASDDRVEASGVELARARQRDADLVILVLDRSEPLTPADCALLDCFPEAVVVANKSDLPAAWEPDRAPPMLTISAALEVGIENLIAAISKRLVPNPPAAGAGVPFRPAQCRLLEQARAALRSGARETAIGLLQKLLAPVGKGAADSDGATGEI